MDGTVPEALTERAFDELRGAAALHLLLDYDGTLVPFAAVPEGAAPDAGLLPLLRALVDRPRTRVTVVSGRDRATMDLWLGGVPGLLRYAEHGRWRHDGASWRERVGSDGAWIDAARPSLLAMAAERDGAFVEEKGRSLVLHHRRVVDAEKSRWVEAVAERARRIAPRGVRVELGNGVVDVRDDALTKAVAAIDALTERGEGERIAAFGDDRTDEDMFRALGGEGLTVCVGDGPSIARYRVPDPAGVRALLAGLAAG